MKKIISAFFILIILVSCQNQQPVENKPEQEVVVATPLVDALKRLSLEEVDQFLSEKESGILYFGWVTNCGDSRNFQENYLEQYLKDNPAMKDKIFVVDLDIELPDALIEKDKRQPLTDKYDVAYSPTLLDVKEGVTVNKVEWQLKTSDPETAIPREVLDSFFSDSGFNQ